MSDELKNLTTGEFLHTLRQVVAEKGANCVYPESEKAPGGTCSYWHNGQPSCIIGHALDALGVAVPPWWEGKSARTVLKNLGAPESVQRVADQAQRVQDNALPWGEALACAEQVAALLAEKEGVPA